MAFVSIQVGGKLSVTNCSPSQAPHYYRQTQATECTMYIHADFKTHQVVWAALRVEKLSVWDFLSVDTG